MTGPNRYIFPSSEAEARRLEEQTKLYGGVGVLAPFFQEKPAEVLDVGCGAGHFTARVAAALPSSSVTGLEIEETRLALARSRLNPTHAGNLAYEHGDMHDMPLETGRFDLVYCRFGLVHDRSATGSLREMARVTRPGGRVVAYDMIHDGIWFVPERPAFQKALRAIVNALRERGAEPNQGLHLPAGMLRAGLRDVAARVIPHHALATDALYEAYRDNWIATLASLSDNPGAGAFLHADLAQAAIRELKRASGDEFIVETTVLAWGKTVQRT